MRLPVKAKPSTHGHARARTGTHEHARARSEAVWTLRTNLQVPGGTRSVVLTPGPVTRVKGTLNGPSGVGGGGGVVLGSVNLRLNAN